MKILAILCLTTFAVCVGISIVINNTAAVTGWLCACGWVGIYLLTKEVK